MLIQYNARRCCVLQNIFDERVCKRWKNVEFCIQFFAPVRCSLILLLKHLAWSQLRRSFLFSFFGPVAEFRTGSDQKPGDLTFPLSLSLFVSGLWLVSRPRRSDGRSRQRWPALCVLNVVIIGALCPEGSLSSRGGEETQRAAESRCWHTAVRVWWSFKTSVLLSSPPWRETRSNQIRGKTV